MSSRPITRSQVGSRPKRPLSHYDDDSSKKIADQATSSTRNYHYVFNVLATSSINKRITISQRSLPDLYEIVAPFYLPFLISEILKIWNIKRGLCTHFAVSKN